MIGLSYTRYLVVFLLLAGGTNVFQWSRVAADDLESAIPVFELDVVHIFKRYCTACHGEGDELAAGLSLLEPELIRQGGKSGPALVDGMPKQSLLFKKILDNSMPPQGHSRLTLEDREILRRWVDFGAPAIKDYERLYGSQTELVSDEDRDHFAWRKLSFSQVPKVRGQSRILSPIDAFLLARLEEKDLTFAPEADGLVLARRLYFDLIGLPPTPRQLDDFVYGWVQNPQVAYGQLVDQLLQSPHFGVRWGRHWLDAAGYVDVCGADENASQIRLPRGGWRYRDYVVQAFNNDKPYHQFLVEQLAGDELFDWRNADQFTPEMIESLVATGYWRTAMDDTDQDVLNIPSNRYAVLFDQMEIFGSSVLGLTLQCARCHSHKYDPIPQRDYFRLLANLTPAFNLEDWLKRDARELADVSPKQRTAIDAENAEIDRLLTPLQKELSDLGQRADVRLLPPRLAKIPLEDRAAVEEAFGLAVDTRSDAQKALLGKHADALLISGEDRKSVQTEEEQRRSKELQGKVSELEADRRHYGFIHALYDYGALPTTRVLVRGETTRPGRPVSPGFLSALCDSDQEAVQATFERHGETSGRRLGLARWATNPESRGGALVARVIVNRVWHHLFGQGLVASPGNFGYSGASPTHPKLLEWLAHDFVASGWKMKRLIRQMVSSTVYRQSSSPLAVESAARAKEIDPDNDLLWRARLRRIESEIVRDAMLRSSAQLDETLNGPPVGIEQREDKTFHVVRGKPTPTSHLRRTLYILSRRNYHMPMLDVFDVPAMTTNCVMRDQSTVVLQSLTMLNDDFIVEHSRKTAEGVAAASALRDGQISLAFKRILSRLPSRNERLQSQEFLKDQAALFASSATEVDGEEETDEQRLVRAELEALAMLCQMLFNSNNFLYLE